MVFPVVGRWRRWLDGFRLNDEVLGWRLAVAAEPVGASRETVC
jgi:hypothetical protein